MSTRRAIACILTSQIKRQESQLEMGDLTPLYLGCFLHLMVSATLPPFLAYAR